MVLVELLGDKRSTCTQKVLILLEELELKYEFKQIDIITGEHKNEEFMKMNPFGKVPVLKYDDEVLFESRSILRYLASNNADSVDLFFGPQVDMWLEVESQNYNPIVSKIVYEKVFKKLKDDSECDDTVVDALIPQLEKILDIYEQRLSESKFVGGDSFSIADISFIPYTHLMIKSGFKKFYKERPHLYKWLKKIMKRDIVKEILSN